MAKLRRTDEQVKLRVGHGGIAIVNALIGETDRGCTLVAGEFLSDELQLYLQQTMRRRGASKDEIRDFLLGLNAPVGNFSPRIKAAHWFGLIGPKTYRTLENIREIRNHCAHRAGPIDLTDTDVKPFVRALGEYVKEIVKLKPQYGELCEEFFGSKDDMFEQKRETPNPIFSSQRRTFMDAVFDVRSSLISCSTIAKDPNKDLDKYHECNIWW